MFKIDVKRRYRMCESKLSQRFGWFMICMSCVSNSWIDCWDCNYRIELHELTHVQLLYGQLMKVVLMIKLVDDVGYKDMWIWVMETGFGLSYWGFKMLTWENFKKNLFLNISSEIQTKDRSKNNRKKHRKFRIENYVSCIY